MPGPITPRAIELFAFSAYFARWLRRQLEESFAAGIILAFFIFTIVKLSPSAPRRYIYYAHFLSWIIFVKSRRHISFWAMPVNDEAKPNLLPVCSLFLLHIHRIYHI